MVRLQFGIRTMALTVLLVCIGLAAWFRSWQETRTDPDNNALETTTTFRRNWKGERQKHGRSITLQNGQLAIEAFYRNDELVLDRMFDESGSMVFEQHHSAEATRQKEWRQIAGELVVVSMDENRSTNVRKFAWHTPSGELLESLEIHERAFMGIAHFQRWNGQPFADEAERFLLQICDPVLQSGWQQIRKPEYERVVEALGEGVYRETWFTGRDTGANHVVVKPGIQHGQLVIYYAENPSKKLASVRFAAAYSYPYLGRDNVFEPEREHPYLQEFLAELADGTQPFFDGDYTLVVRYGLVCAVPINKRSLQNKDPGGVQQIHFAAGSAEEHDWRAEIPPLGYDHRTPAERAQAIFANTALRVDATQIAQRAAIEPPLLPYLGTVDPPCLRRRCDLFGQFLWHHGLTVRQDGNVLVIVPRED